MSKLRQLIEAANRKCEMAWKVYSYNPEKDNELVDTSKAFDCIAAAQVHKRDILEKNPNYIVEIIAESAQYKFKVGDRVLYEGDKATVIALRTTNTSPYYDVEKDKEKGKQHHPAYERELKPLQESTQKNEAFGPEDIVPFAKQMEFKKQYLQGKDKRKVNPNSFYFDNVYAVDDNTGSNIPGAKLGMKYKDLAAALDKFFGESTQKNEDFYKYIDDVPTREIAKALKELGIKEPYATQKAKIADKLAKRFGLRRVPTPFEMTSILDALPYFKEEAANIDVKNPGVLEVPDGKKVDELPQSHFEKLVDKKGYAEVIRALTNLEVWNKDKDKSLSQWASNMADKLKKKFRPESAQKNEDDFQQRKDDFIKDIKEIIRYVNAGYGKESENKKKLDFWNKKYDATYNALKDFSLNDLAVKSYTIKLTSDRLDPTILKNKFDAAIKSSGLTKPRKLVNSNNTFVIYTESAQKNETSLRDLNLDLSDDTNEIVASVNKIRQRFEYRTLQNQSYDEKQAEKIYLEVRKALKEAKKLIDVCYNKIG